MPTAKKAQTIEELTELLARSAIAITTDYRGLTVSQMTQLRRRLRESGAEYHVVKNSLARLAAEKVGKSGLAQVIQGPTALAIGFGDVAAPAKTLAEFTRTTRLDLPIRGALLGDSVLSGPDVSRLATLPPREVIIGQVLGGLKSPLYGLANVLAAPMRGLVNVLNARVQQMEQSAG
ncbi:MAG: 50S ribosomal protein L10 [Chloroflexi bacterium]|nr:50S ribosomal protein L10 [Chloroflexota bacterium]